MKAPNTFAAQWAAFSSEVLVSPVPTKEQLRFIEAVFYCGAASLIHALNEVGDDESGDRASALIAEVLECVVGRAKDSRLKEGML